jgi:hypothetical protein
VDERLRESEHYKAMRTYHWSLAVIEQGRRTIENSWSLDSEMAKHAKDGTLIKYWKNETDFKLKFSRSMEEHFFVTALYQSIKFLSTFKKPLNIH